MRISLLEKIKCVRCGSMRLDFIAGSADEIEITSGAVNCRECGLSYPIKGGILDAVVDRNEIIEAEVKGNAVKSMERKSHFDEEWLLSLPGGFINEPDKEGEYYDHYNFEQVLEYLQIKSSDTVLDLGCGTTWTSNELARKSRGVIATDISVEKFIGLESARVFIEKYGNFYERVRTDMCRTPFRDSSIDVTVNEASVHHAHSLDLALKEISRILKKGGRAVFINEPSSSILDFREPKARSGFFERETYGWNENKYNIIEYAGSVKRAGLEIERIFYPESVRQKLFALANRRGQLKNYKYVLGKVIAGPYKNSHIARGIFEKALFYPMLLIGLPFCAVAVKP